MNPISSLDGANSSFSQATTNQEPEKKQPWQFLAQSVTARLSERIGFFLHNGHFPEIEEARSSITRSLYLQTALTEADLTTQKGIKKFSDIFTKLPTLELVDLTVVQKMRKLPLKEKAQCEKHLAIIAKSTKPEDFSDKDIVIKALFNSEFNRTGVNLLKKSEHIPLATHLFLETFTSTKTVDLLDAEILTQLKNLPQDIRVKCEAQLFERVASLTAADLNDCNREALLNAANACGYTNLRELLLQKITELLLKTNSLIEKLRKAASEYVI
ncbi:MAG: hypothetical protein JWO53_1159 [Chlamydiia bacterium]|nr:hypothetical protein [Chlamydiia bacterium]